MNGSLAFSSLATAAQVLAICMSEMMPSCMRAPPEAETMMKARLKRRACSMARTIFSPVPLARLPPRKRKSMTASTTRVPATSPLPVMTDSLMPSFFTVASAFALYGSFASLKFSGSEGTMCWLNSRNEPESTSRSMRSRHPRRS